MSGADLEVARDEDLDELKMRSIHRRRLLAQVAEWRVTGVPARLLAGGAPPPQQHPVVEEADSLDGSMLGGLLPSDLMDGDGGGAPPQGLPPGAALGQMEKPKEERMCVVCLDAEASARGARSGPEPSGRLDELGWRGWW